MSITNERKGKHSKSSGSRLRNLFEYEGVTRQEARTKEALRESEEKLRIMFNSLKDGIIVTDFDGTIVEANEAALRLYGYSNKGDMIGRSGTELVAEKDQDRATQQWMNVLEGESPEEITQRYTVIRPDGGEIEIESSGAALHDKHGEPVAFISIARDITERIRKEELLRESEERFRAIFDSATDGILLADVGSKKFYMGNEKICRMLGYDQEELRELGLMDIHPEDKVSYVMEQFDRQAKGEIEVALDIPVKRKDGSVFYSDISSAPIHLNGNTYVVGHFRDITERKRMEAELEKSAKKLRLIIESIGDILFITDMELNIVNVNEAAVRALGYENQEQLVGQSANSQIAEKDRARVTVYIGKALVAERGGGTIEYTLVAKDGGEFDVEANTEILRDCAGKLVGLIVTARDITDRKRMQEEVRASGEKLHTILESMSDGVIVIDMLGGITDANESAVRMFEYGSKRELVGKNAMDTIAERDQQKCAAAIQESIEAGGTPSSLEFVMVTKGGREFNAELGTSMLHDSEGNMTGFVGVIRNVTERKRMEAELEKAAEKLRIVIESIGDMLFITDMELNLTNVNEASVRKLGYSDKAQLLKKSIMEPVAAKDRTRVAVELGKGLANKRGQDVMSYTLVSADGQEFDVEAATEVLHDCAGKTVGLIVTARDVTERKRMEEVVRTSEEKLRVMFDSVNDGIVVVDMLGNIQQVNDATLNMLGYAREELIGKSVLDLAYEEDRNKVIEDMGKIVESKKLETAILSYRPVRKDGSLFDAEMGVGMLRDAEGNVNSIIAVMRDVTERKRMQEELRKTAEKLRIIIESIGDMLIITDRDLKYTNVNEATVKMLGCKDREELIGREVAEPIAEKDRERVVRELKRALKQKESIELLEFALVGGDGGEFEVEATVEILRDCANKVVGLIMTARDVTERKRMQEVVRSSEEKLHTVLESMSDGVIVLDMFGGIMDVNDSAVRMFEYGSSEELVGKTALDTIAERDHQKCADAIQRSIEAGGTPSSLEFVMVTKGGREFDAELGTSMLHDSEGNMIGFVGVVRDITERKRWESALKESEERLSTMFDAVRDGIIIIDLEVNMLQVNEATLQMTGYSREDLIGKSALEFVAEYDRMKVVEDMAKTLEDKKVKLMPVYHLVRKDGSEFEAELGSGMMLDKEGNVAGFVGVIRDVTERRRMEEEVRKTAEKLRIMFDSIKDAVIVSDMSGTILEVNDAALQISGWSREEFVNKNAIEILAEKDRDAAIESIMKQAEGEVTMETAECTLILSGGKELEAEFTASLMRDAEGNPMGTITVARDITERKQMQEELRKTAEKLRIVIESIGDMIIITDRDLKYTNVNEATVRMLGCTDRESLIGTDITEAVAGRDRDSVTRALKGALKRKTSIEALGYAFVTADGKEFEAEATVEILRDCAGKVVGLIISARDVTERKRMMEALRDSEEKKRLIFESLRDSVMVVDLKGDVVEANEACLRQLGYSREELLRMNTLQFVSEKDKDRAVENAVKMVSVGVADDYFDYSILALVTKEGKEIEVEHSTALMRDSLGKPAYVIGIARDITERKRAEEALRASEEKLRTMFNSIKDGIVVTDMTGKIVEGNEMAFRMAGYDSLAEVTGRNPVEFISEKDRPRLVEDLTRFFEKGEAAEHLEYTMVKKDGGEFDIELSISTLHDADGNTSGFIAVERDVTERKRMQDQINRMVEDLKRSNAELEQFAYVASHDLQEPLRMISSYTQLLARRYKGKLEPEADEFIEFAVDGSTRMQTMVQALLTYSRVGTRGKPPEPTECETVLALAKKNLQAALQEKEAEVTNDPLPTIMADDVQMVQLFQNLIGNGIKFQSEGVQPHVHVSVEDKGEEWLFSFKDNGIGIDPEYKERIFVIFQRLHSKQTYKGTGIGLSVCKKIVERHGGTIWVESELGKGATFCFTIPKYREEAIEEAKHV